MSSLTRVSLLLVSSLMSFIRDRGPVHAQSEAGELFRAFSSNWEAIEDFDVCIKSEEFWLDVDDRLDEKVVVYRMIGDFSTNQYLFVFRGNNVVDAPGVETTHHKVTGGFFYDFAKRQAAMRLFPEKAEPIAITNPTEMLAKSNFPDPRRVGGYETPRNFDPKFPIKDLYDAQYHVGKSLDMRLIRDGVANFTVDDLVGTGPLRMRRTFEFDLERLVPLQISYSFETDERKRKVRTESLEWVEKEGIQLPLRVSGEEMVSQKSGGRSVMLPREYTVSFHWNYVNRSEQVEIDRNMLVDDEVVFRLIREAEEAFTTNRESKK